jgi:hypothetical protein
MSGISDAHHFRKMMAGACMTMAPLLLLVGLVVHPEQKTDEAAQLSVVADNLDAWYMAHLLVFAAIVLTVPAVLGLMHMLREREVAFGHVGGGLAMLGLIALTGLVAIEGFVGWQMGAGGDRAQMVALLERLDDTAGVFIPFFLMPFAFTVGMIFLAIGLYKARAVQSWMCAFIAISVICLAVGGPAAIDWLMIVGAAFLFVGLGSIGRLVLSESDQDWEHTPEYEGFRPLLGMR